MTCRYCRKFKKKITRENCREIFNELLTLNKQGNIHHIPSHPPLEDTWKIIHAESSYGVVQEFKCSCGSNIKWSVCIRGAPGLWVTSKNEPAKIYKLAAFGFIMLLIMAVYFASR